jgi:multiple sugar transport system permease protein
MTRSRVAGTLRALAIAAIVCWSLSPILLGFITSLSSQTDIQAVPARWLPSHASLDAYRSLLGGTANSRAGGTVTESGTFGKAMLNSATITFMSTIAILVVSIMAGYGFTRLRFRLSRALFWGLLATMIVPVFTVVVALFKLMADAHLIDTKLGLVLVFVSTQTPLATWLFHNHIRDMPGEPEEAALIDGCTRWQAFYRVVVPQMRSGIAALSAILMLAVWGEFLIPLLLSSTLSAKPVTVLITEFIGKYTTNYPLLSAAGILALLPPAIVALVLNRHIRGMLSGAS